ncbi:hypothetical protein M2428_000987 [Arthrobacter sp. ES3-54]|nr:hypothetical protein [Arthrobacter sp. ES3-54]
MVVQSGQEFADPVSAARRGDLDRGSATVDAVEGVGTVAGAK